MLDTTTRPDNWTPLHLHTHYSLLDGLSKPHQVAERCKELGYTSCAITDHGTISGAVSFTSAMKKAGIKPILGCEFYLTEDLSVKDKANRFLSHLVVLAKNKEGWHRLIEATSASNEKENYYFKPRLDLDTLANYADGNLIAFSGHIGSDMANVIFDDFKSAYNAESYDEAKQFIAKDWLEKSEALAKKYQSIFGDGNFFLEIQVIDQENCPASTLVAEGLRYLSRKTGIPCVATADSHYPRREDAADQRVLLCAAMKTTYRKVKKRLDAGEDVGLSGFFKSFNYHIPSFEEMSEIHTDEEILNANFIADMCEEYEILGEPMLPKFPCPEEYTEDGFLRELCRQGWKEKLLDKGKVTKNPDDESTSKYLQRIKEELSVISGANLAGYFLIVKDIVESVSKNSWLPGPGRGSAAGCLVSYLIGVTQVDPIEYGLIFERFYNAGRNTKDRVSLPDIDIDVPASKRDDVIGYIKKTYGEGRVGQMITFGRLQGRSALKEVLRVHDACSYEEMNRITKSLPHEADISDQLQEMDESSVIMWTLHNQPEQLKDYCRIRENGSLDGPYAKYFEQAMRIEGTYKSQGKHAAGVVISLEELNRVCPMVKETNGSAKIAGLEMSDLEAMGHVKFDILGVNLLDKMMSIQSTLGGQNV